MVSVDLRRPKAEVPRREGVMVRSPANLLRSLVLHLVPRILILTLLDYAAPRI